MIILFQFVLADNLAERNMSLDQYVTALERDKFHGYDSSLHTIQTLKDDHWRVE